MDFTSRLALQQRRIGIARENYREYQSRLDKIVNQMQAGEAGRSIDYLAGLADAAVERCAEAHLQWDAEIDALCTVPTLDDYRDYSQASGYREEGDYRLWEPQDWVELEHELANAGPGAMSRGELNDYDYSDIEEF